MKKQSKNTGKCLSRTLWILLSVFAWISDAGGQSTVNDELSAYQQRYEQVRKEHLQRIDGLKPFLSIGPMVKETRDLDYQLKTQVVQLETSAVDSIKILSWNIITGTPHRIIFQGEGPAIGTITPETVEETVKNFISTRAYLKADFQALRLNHAEEINPQLKKWYVTLDQYYSGLRVFGGQVDLAIADGTLYWIGSDFYPRIPQLSTTPAIDTNQAIDIAINYKGFDPTKAEVVDIELGILPLNQKKYDNTFEVQYHLAYKIALLHKENFSSAEVYVSSQGQVLLDVNLNIENHISDVTISGTVRGEVNERRERSRLFFDFSNE